MTYTPSPDEVRRMVYGDEVVSREHHPSIIGATADRSGPLTFERLLEIQRELYAVRQPQIKFVCGIGQREKALQWLREVVLTSPEHQTQMFGGFNDRLMGMPIYIEEDDFMLVTRVAMLIDGERAWQGRMF